MGILEMVMDQRRQEQLVKQGSTFQGLLGQPSQPASMQVGGQDGLMADVGIPGTGVRGQFENFPARIAEEAELAKITSGLDIRGGAIGFIEQINQQIEAKANFEEFQVTETRHNEADRQAQANWVEEHKIDLAKESRDANQAALQTLLTTEQIAATKAGTLTAANAARMATEKHGRLSQADRNSLVQFKDDFFAVNNMMTLYQDGFAINTAGPKGDIEQWLENTKDANTAYDLDRKAFYQRETAYQAAVINRLSGTASAEAEVARLSKMFIQPSDDDKTVINKLKMRHADIIRQQGDLREVNTGQGFIEPGGLDIQPLRKIFTEPQFAPPETPEERDQRLNIVWDTPNG